MRAKRVWFIIPALLLACVGTWFVVQQYSSALKIRHIVLISLDTTRADHLSCFGYSRPTTPNIDALAKQGYLFSNAMTPIPFTLPAHASMFTGTIPLYHGKHSNQTVFFDPAQETLASLLRAKGYRTGAFVGTQVLNSNFGLNSGFDEYDDTFANAAPERSAEEVNRVAFQWLEKQTDEPVFLFIHYYDAHKEYAPPEPFATSFKDDPYAGEIAYTDHCIGQVIEKLKDLNMYDSTLIIVTSDHGEMLGEHGELTHTYFIYQSALHVPMVYKLPGSNTAHKIEDLASIIDIVPTVCDLVGIEPPVEIQGKNLAGYFRNDPPLPEDRYLYCESMQPVFYGANSLVGLVGRQWKYIHTTRPELFDLQRDPGEQVNLVETESRQADILKENLNQISKQAVRPEIVQKGNQLAPKLMDHLRTLGYVGESATPGQTVFDTEKEDPKDLIELHNSWHEAQHLVEDNKLAEARLLIEAAIEKCPVYLFYESATRICLKMEDYKAAIKYGEKAVELQPSSLNARELLVSAFSSDKQDEAAADQFKQALEHLPDGDPQVNALRAKLHFELGMIRARQLKFDLAIVQFNRSLEFDSQQPHVLNALATALLDANGPDRDPSKALPLAQLACGMTQMENPTYLKTFARAHASLNNANEAITVTERALTLASAAGDTTLADELREQLQRFKQGIISWDR